MKKNFIYATLSAIALVGAVSLSACSSSEDVENPNYNAETNMVKTQFSISIPVGNGQLTRMDGDGAPDNGVFKGMTNIKLYPFKTATEVAGTEDIATPITLEAINENDLDKTGTDGNNFHGKVYNDVQIPVGTKTFLFYGQITDPKGGALEPTYGTEGTPAANIKFELSPIQKTYTMANVKTNDTQAAAILTDLNAIVAVLKTQLSDATTASHISAAQLNALLTAFKGLRAGSAASVLAFIQNAYNFLKGQTGGYAAAVCTEIEKYFTATSSGDPVTYTLTWKTTNTFPGNIDLPDGAIGLAYNDDPTTDGEYYSFASVTTSGNSQPELNTYVKPAALQYYVNTPLHTDNEAHASQYNSQTSWANVLALYDGGTEVLSSTRGIVLDNPIQYGVGRLKANVKIGSGTLYANNESGDATAVTPPTNGYPITGILIGGQKDVNWNFEPIASETSYTIYDPVWTDNTANKATTTGSGYNYTLALQTNKDETVSIAVELTNDGDAFYGVDNRLIPAGSKFYLIAKLTPSNGTAYAAGDNTKNRVFCQDVETTATLTISTNSLKKAYNTIPDLRAAKMELGLSVDLSWTAGLSFETNFEQE